jgi:hypothetical protein
MLPRSPGQEVAAASTLNGASTGRAYRGGLGNSPFLLENIHSVSKTLKRKGVRKHATPDTEQSALSLAFHAPYVRAERLFRADLFLKAAEKLVERAFDDRLDDQFGNRADLARHFGMGVIVQAGACGIISQINGASSLD